MIQILGLRLYQKRDGSWSKKHLHDKEWTAPNVAEVFANPSHWLAPVPLDERYNIFFTPHMNDMDAKRPRQMTEQHGIFVDVDDVDAQKAKETAQAVCEALKCEYQKTGVICSGRGLHIFVPLEIPVDAAYFKDPRNKRIYKAVAAKVNAHIKSKSLRGYVDTNTFAPKFLIRYPGTINKKKDLPDAKVELLQGHVEAHGWRLENVVNIPGLTDGAVDDSPEVSQFKIAPDRETIEEECLFIKHCKENQSNVNEAQWYAMQSIVGHFKNGRELVHEYSKEHPSYSPEETDAKLDQALVASGPRTCANIDTLWDGCKNCKHFRSDLKSPISIRGKNFIATETTGLYYVTHTDDGRVKREPAYEDMVKYYRKKHGPHFSIGRNIIYTYHKDEKIWKESEEKRIKSFIYNSFDPRPRNRVVVEAYETLCNTDAKSIDYFDRAGGLINMQNGVYDIKNDVLLPHSHKYAFRNIVDFEFDPKADCPNFRKFLEDVTVNDESLQKVLMEFVGYILSGDRCFIHKALILLGSGRNGKSTFNQVVGELLGHGNYAAIPMKKLNDPTYLYLLEGKLANIADENSPDSLLDSDMFKTLVAGGEYPVKKLYAQPYNTVNRAKFIFNCNEMPISKDRTNALHERMAIVPFDAHFDKGTADKKIFEKLIGELPGIFNLAVEGFKRCYTQMDFTESARMDDMIDTFVEGQDDFGRWFNDNIMLTENSKDIVYQDDLYKNYWNYMKELDGFPQRRAQFYHMTKTALSRYGVPQIRKRKPGSRNPVSAFEKVRLKDYQEGRF